MGWKGHFEHKGKEITFSDAGEENYKIAEIGIEVYKEKNRITNTTEISVKDIENFFKDACPRMSFFSPNAGDGRNRFLTSSFNFQGETYYVPMGTAQQLASAEDFAEKELSCSNFWRESSKAPGTNYAHKDTLEKNVNSSSPGGTTASKTSSAKAKITMQTDNIHKILDDNKQVILTGAPGTGKTYTVKEYVKRKTGESEPDTHWTLVQFHPSYDYSDFVEGLKPVPDPKASGNMFVRIDGCFKAFCRKIVSDELNIIKKSHPSWKDEQALEEYKKRYQKDTRDDSGDGTDSHLEKSDMKVPIDASSDNTALEEKKQEYYFIIDEINRADLSKVFGEIMYCLDEDYRGPANAIKTQYSALQTYHKDGTGNFVPYIFDCFEDGFFIPENLHIIGTMNDIDRSVESFDFALRRRFIWKEIDANGSIEELDSIVKITAGTPYVTVPVLIDRAIKVNNLFVKDEYKRLGLTKQFQLGKAYYKNYDGTEDSLKSIYTGKIEPIVKEYTRGRDFGLVNSLLTKIWDILFLSTEPGSTSPTSEDVAPEGNESAQAEENGDAE